MSGPGDEQQALQWIQAAFAVGRTFLVPHAQEERMLEREIDFPDIRHAIENATGCQRYTRGTPKRGGTCWRVFGPDLDQLRTIAIGVEAYLDKKRRHAVVITVFDPNAKDDQ